jgi:hypothetical protein
MPNQKPNHGTRKGNGGTENEQKVRRKKKVS